MDEKSRSPAEKFQHTTGEKKLRLEALNKNTD